MLKHITKGETSYIGLCKKIYHDAGGKTWDNPC